MISDALSIARKEFADTITSKRLWLIVGLLLLFSVASTYSTIFQVITAFQQIGRPVASVFSSIAATMAYMAPLLGIALAFDAISGERERGTLRVLLSRPIYREDVINGKIISALTVISLAITLSSFAAVSISILLHNIVVTVDDITRVCLFIVFSIVFSFAYYAFSLFISTLSNKSSHSLIISIGIWIFFAFILSVISSLVTTAILGPPPVRSFQAFNMSRRQFGNITFPNIFSQEYSEYMRRGAEISSTIQVFSINYHYTQITSLLFGYATRPIEFGQGGRTLTSISTVVSTRLIDIVILVVFPVVFLFSSYMVFTRRQEK